MRGCGEFARVSLRSLPERRLLWARGGTSASSTAETFFRGALRICQRVRGDNGAVSAIEQHVDDLYQLPLSAFTSARNALAKTLKGDDAARVKGLAKPTVVPWTVNQLYWHRRSTYDRVFTAGRAVRSAQIAALGGQGGDVGRANDAHRKALAAAVRDGVALAAAHALTPSTDQLARMLELLSLRPASHETPGRYTELVHASGLEALAGITLAHATGGADQKTPAHRKDDTHEHRDDGPKRSLAVPSPDAERRRAEKSAAARTRAEENAAAAARGLDQARNREETAQRDVVLAQEALEQSQLALETARRARRAANEVLVAAKALT